MLLVPFQCFKKPYSLSCLTDRLQLIARAKWDAWSKLGNMSKADAQRAYVDALTKSDPQWQTKAKNMKIKSKL
jgi:hypothetical protein